MDIVNFAGQIVVVGIILAIGYKIVKQILDGKIEYEGFGKKTKKGTKKGRHAPNKKSNKKT